MNTQATTRPRGGPKTLIFTHLTPKLPATLKTCTRFLETHRANFDRRIALCDEEGRWPLNIKDRPGLEQAIPSYNGSLEQPDSPAAQLGYAGPGSSLMVLGGGFLDVCLLRTFASLVNIKSRQGEPLQVAIPLPLIYTYAKMPVDRFVLSENVYSRHLAESFALGKITGYQISADGNRLITRNTGMTGVTLNWFSSVEKLFDSGLLNR